MKYLSTKTWGHEVGLSCAFRQWRAQSHCHLLHGYAIAVKVVFGADELNDKNWVYDFGNTKWIKEALQYYFDHTVLIAEDDPQLSVFQKLDSMKLVNLRVLEDVGCEAFAEFIYNSIQSNVNRETNGRVKVMSVEVMEHGANSAVFNG